MPVESYPDLFNHVYGPVMQPGSSSHTAGPCRLGFLTCGFLGETPRTIRVTLDPEGSFAGTFGLMSEDGAMVAGALGMGPDDPRLFDAGAIAKARGIDVRFEFAPIAESRHPNAVRFELTAADGRSAVLVGDSTGGGMVEIRAVDGFPVRLVGDAHVRLIFDSQGSVNRAALERACATLDGFLEIRTVEGEGRNVLHVVRAAAEIPAGALRPVVGDARTATLPPVLSVLETPGRKPPVFVTMHGWKSAAEAAGERLSDVVIRYETASSGWDRERVLARMREIAEKMHRQTHAPYDENLAPPESPFKPDYPAMWRRHMASERRVTGDAAAELVRLAYGAGAGIPGVETVTGPMGSGGGYLYAALYAAAQRKGWGAETVVRGLFTAGGVGLLAFLHTEPTGECLGCSGECGINGAMAAAGLVEMAGGSPDAAEAAASLALQGAMGWPCDPIPGGFGQPCRSRIMTAVCMAPVFADMAMAGHPAVLSLDEAIQITDRIGRALPSELRCTSRGGAAVAASSLRQKEAFRKWFEESRKTGRKVPPGNLI